MMSRIQDFSKLIQTKGRILSSKKTIFVGVSILTKEGDFMLQSTQTVLAHWSTLVEDMQASPREFYNHVVAAVDKREIPAIRIERVTRKEGGLLSADREYLRVIRGRYRYDICAAPFGTGFFFSSWMAEKLPSPLWAIIGFLVLPFVALWLFAIFAYFGGVIGFLMWSGGIVTGIVFFIIALSKEESVFADHIFVVPYLGAFLEKMFRPDTYFRQDTETMFRTMAHNAVLNAVDATTKATGARELTSDERKPVLREFFQR